MTGSTLFFLPTDYAVFEGGLASNAEYDGERERVHDKLAILHKRIYPEIRRHKRAAGPAQDGSETVTL